MLRAPHVCFVVLMASRFVFGQDFDFAEYKSSRHEKPQLQQQWKKAKSSSDKDKIQKDLMKLVSKKFDEDMQDRQRQIAAIEKRLERLRQLYKKRQNAKPKIVELQTTAIIMDWDGLGFAPQGSRL